MHLRLMALDSDVEMDSHEDEMFLQTGTVRWSRYNCRFHRGLELGMHAERRRRLGLTSPPCWREAEGSVFPKGVFCAATCTAYINLQLVASFII
ncbi:hypothetical protein VTN77DRAFT_9904 [Rasamsonia byssochlamydoides]|uniref:uncharacterized protein n=1 Tax=Rasamsonia byssochlamydoides TaxID=89139 RepID=UPI0037429C03